METTPQKNLEEMIHRELSKLPERPAPETLVPRVLAQLQARAQKHWWQYPWTRWPSPLKVLSVPFLLSSVAGAVFGVSFLWNLLQASLTLEPVAQRLEPVSALWDILSVLGNAVVVLGRAAGHEWLLLALFVPLAMYLACVGLGTLCYRVALYHR